MICVNHYAIRPPIPKTMFIKRRRVEIMAFPFVLFHRDRFFNFCCPVRQRFSAAYLLKLFLLPQRAHTTRFIRYDKPQLTRWAFVQLACWHTDVSRWSGGQPWQLLPSHRRRHCWCSHTSPPPNSQCSHRVVLAPFLHNVQPSSDRCLIFASHLATGMLLAIAIISRLLCLPGTCGLFKYFPKNDLLSFFRNMNLPSTCYMQGDWYCLALP